MSLDTRSKLQESLRGLVLEGELGGGGMSHVYMARDERLGRKVVVKLLRPELAASISAERFEREILLAASLQHANIVPLLHAGDAGGLPYFTMPFVEGESLRARLASGPLSISEAISVLRDVVGALSYAHGRGVVHRDIKPDNVLLSSGIAVVTDFGIAKALSASRTDSGGATLTEQGIAIGTPAYMSPEQVAGDSSVDHRTDIYAVGCMAYEMLTGRTPFHGRPSSTTLAAHVLEPPLPLTHWRADVPAPLADLVTSCLAKNVRDRPQSASDIGAVLDRISSGNMSALPLSSSADTRPAKTRLMLYGLGIVAVGVLAVVSATTQLFRAGRDGLRVADATVDSGMVLVPMGTYVIGSSSGPLASRPPHAVRLNAFGIDRQEVTISDYQRFVEAGLAQATWESNASPRLPVMGVLQAEAASYCAWKHADGGRLPTEEEWEAAARGTGERAYPWGNSWDSTAANVASPDGRPVAVGSFPRGRTPEGMEDMIGNVWEWTSSPFTPYDGVASDTGLYVIRGGAHNSLVEVATAYYRGRARAVSPRSHLAATGFRCAMSARQPGVIRGSGR